MYLQELDSVSPLAMHNGHGEAPSSSALAAAKRWPQRNSLAVDDAWQLIDVEVEESVDHVANVGVSPR